MPKAETMDGRRTAFIDNPSLETGFGNHSIELRNRCAQKNFNFISHSFAGQRSAFKSLAPHMVPTRIGQTKYSVALVHIHMYRIGTRQVGNWRYCGFHESAHERSVLFKERPTFPTLKN
jgi:hypothetical protein